MLSGDGKYSASKPQSWLKDVRDYLAGRTSDMDALLNWVEKQDDEIVGEESGGGSAPMVCFAPSVKEVSRQLWALLHALTKHDATVAGNFANVPRHNGLEAWRRIAEPINDDKALIRKSLLAIVTNPKPAGSLERVEQALADWDTNTRLFLEADGPVQDEQSWRISLEAMLPSEIQAHITMHWEQPEYSSFMALKKYVLKYVKNLESTKATLKPVHAVTQPELEVPAPPEAAMTEEDEAECERLMDRLIATEDPVERAEICAVMRTRGFRAPTRG